MADQVTLGVPVGMGGQVVGLRLVDRAEQGAGELRVGARSSFSARNFVPGRS